MPRNLFLMRDVTDFGPGAFENTVMEGESIQLARRGREHLPGGSYTSPSIRLEPFLKLVPSWNADTPAGTTVEIEVRVAAGGHWTQWFRFGAFSPFIYRASPEPQADAIAHTDRESILINDGQPPADMAQIRARLYTNDVKLSPGLRLLAVAAQPLRFKREEPQWVARELEVPVYSCLVRDPSIADRIASPTALTMLMNRRGEDLLPEELARAMYDSGGGRYNNRAFFAAACGMYGHECYAHYCSVDALRREVRWGHAAAAELCYRAPALGDEERPETMGEAPILPDAISDSAGHLVVVRGFVWVGDEEQVVFNDPLAPTDEAVRRQVPVSLFKQMYTGLAWMLHRGPRGAGSARPARLITHMELTDDEILLSAHGENLEPGRSVPGEASRSTLCYTLSDGIAYASAAQKKFYYIQMDDKGRLRFDRAAAEGRKMTLYLIGSRGAVWVAEKDLGVPKFQSIAPAAPAAEPAAGPL